MVTQTRLNKILPLSGSQTVLITSGGNDTLIEIPTKVFNLARSHLYFVFTPATSGGGNYNWMNMDVISMIRQIQLYTRSGIYICDLNFANKYTSAVFKVETKIDEYLSLSESNSK